MPLSKDDVLLNLRIASDAKEALDELRKSGTAADQLSKAASGFMMAAMNEAGSVQRKSMEFAETMAAWQKEQAKEEKKQLDEVVKIKSATELRLEAEKALHDELAGQHTLLEKIRAASNPAHLREQVKVERQIAEARKTHGKAQQEEERRQGGGMWKQMWGAFTGRGEGKGGKEGGIGRDLASLIGGQGGGQLGQIGAVAGAALGLPPEVGEAIAKALPGVIAGPAKLAAGALGGVADALTEMQGPLGPIGAGFNAMTASLKGMGDLVKNIPLVGELLGPAVDALAALPGILKQITGTLTSMSALASPGSYKMWQFALQDVQATIGNRFVPVLHMMTEMVNEFSDALAMLLPNQAEVSEALQPLRESLGELKLALRDFLREFGPQVRAIFVEGMREMVSATRLAMSQLKLFTDAMTTLSKLIGHDPVMRTLIFGFGADAKKGEDRGRTRAAQAASITGLEEYQKQIWAATLTSPGEQKPEERSANYLQTIAVDVAVVADWIRGKMKLADDVTGGELARRGSVLAGEELVRAQQRWHDLQNGAARLFGR